MTARTLVWCCGGGGARGSAGRGGAAGRGAEDQNSKERAAKLRVATGCRSVRVGGLGYWSRHGEGRAHGDTRLAAEGGGRAGGWGLMRAMGSGWRRALRRAPQRTQRDARPGERLSLDALLDAARSASSFALLAAPADCPDSAGSAARAPRLARPGLGARSGERGEVNGRCLREMRVFASIACCLSSVSLDRRCSASDAR